MPPKVKKLKKKVLLPVFSGSPRKASEFPVNRPLLLLGVEHKSVTWKHQESWNKIKPLTPGWRGPDGLAFAFLETVSILTVRD